jgi:hypothetical protein
VQRTKQPPAATVYATDAVVAMTGASVSPQVSKFTDAESHWVLFGPGATIKKHKVRDLRVGIARDGKSAWASFRVKVSVDSLSLTGSIDYRASQLLVRTDRGWLVRSGAWSIGATNTALTNATKAGKLGALEMVVDENVGDREVIAALGTLIDNGLDATAIGRHDLIAIGTAPGEVTIGGKQLAARLKRDWVGHAVMDGAAWAVTSPSGTTACATVNVELTGGKLAIPTRLFVVFEKDDAGTWSPVHVHTAVPAT